MAVDIHIIRMNKTGEKYGCLKAFADVEINNAILIRGLFIMSGKNGVYVSMPRQKGKNNQWYEIVKILNRQLKEEVFSRVLLEYEKLA